MKNTDIAAIILAAGESKRLGNPKQLLDWFGKPFISQVVDTAKMAGLSPIIVVTGAHNEIVAKSISSKEVVIAHNPNWSDGQSTSLICGAKEFEKYNIESFIVMLCDQPQIPGELLTKIVKESFLTNKEVIATRVNNEICPPIFFKKRCVNEIGKLSGDQGGRRLINKNNSKLVDWDDSRILLDVDTEEEYRRLVSLYQ